MCLRSLDRVLHHTPVALVCLLAERVVLGGVRGASLQSLNISGLGLVQYVFMELLELGANHLLSAYNGLGELMLLLVLVVRR